MDLNTIRLTCSPVSAPGYNQADKRRRREAGSTVPPCRQVPNMLVAGSKKGPAGRMRRVVFGGARNSFHSTCGKPCDIQRRIQNPRMPHRPGTIVESTSQPPNRLGFQRSEEGLKQSKSAESSHTLNSGGMRKVFRHINRIPVHDNIDISGKNRGSVPDSSVSGSPVQIFE